MKNNQIKILVFTSKTCTHCHRLIKMLEEKGVLEQIGADMRIVDINDNLQLVGKYDITAVPTTVILDGDELKNKIVGNISKNMLEAAIRRI